MWVCGTIDQATQQCLQWVPLPVEAVDPTTFWPSVVGAFGVVITLWVTALGFGLAARMIRKVD